VQIEIVQSNEYARRKREKLDWKVMLEKAIEREMIRECHKSIWRLPREKL
jgi:thiamine biosynthesis protein ThiC